jgi:hypothetical protein
MSKNAVIAHLNDMHYNGGWDEKYWDAWVKNRSEGGHHPGTLQELHSWIHFEYKHNLPGSSHDHRGLE